MKTSLFRCSTIASASACAMTALPASLGEPPKRLVGWAKVALQPCEARSVSVALPAQRVSIRDANAHAWRIAAGSYRLSAAASSRDPRALSTTVTLAVH